MEKMWCDDCGWVKPVWNEDGIPVCPKCGEDLYETSPDGLCGYDDFDEDDRDDETFLRQQEAWLAYGGNTEAFYEDVDNGYI